MIHSVGNSSDECKFLVKFGTKYAADQPNKYHGNHPIPRKIFRKNQENHAIINNLVNEILKNEPQKVSAANNEEPNILESDYDDNDLYHMENMSLEETKNID